MLELKEFLDLFKAAGLSDADLQGGGGGGGVVQVAAAAAPAGAPAEAAAEEKEALHQADAALMRRPRSRSSRRRALTGLGLKEAKEAVEGAPSVLKKEVKKEEAEEIVKEAHGAWGRGRARKCQCFSGLL